MPMQHHHQVSSSVGMLRRSRTLHHRPPPQEYRRRASHPASPSYCAATMHHCVAATPHNVCPPGLPEDGELMTGVVPSHSVALSVSPQQHSTTLGHMRPAETHERCYDSNANGQMTHYDCWHSQERVLMAEPALTERDREIEREMEQQRQMQKEMELKREREREAQIQEELDRERQREMERKRIRERQQRLQSMAHSSQSGDVNDTWPKPASRQSQGGGGARGLYSTLEGHIGSGSSAAVTAPSGWDAKTCSINAGLNPNPSAGPQLKPNVSSKTITNTRVSRNQLLRDRASQLADERSGMSTDEETNTDMLLGRYWSRTERREHFLLAREQKQQQLLARAGVLRDVASRTGAAAGGAGGGAALGDGGAQESRGVGPFAEGRCNTVLEMSQKKLSRLRNRKLLDDWTTVEELLTHGTRLDSHEDTMCPSSLLTVTTV